MGVPIYAHQLITLLLGSQVKHDIIYTRANRKRVEDWLHSVVKFYRYEYKQRCTRSRAMMMLQRNEEELRRIIEMIISFENILTTPKSPTPTKMNSGGGGDGGDGGGNCGKKSEVQKFLDMLTHVYDDIRETMQQ